MTDLVFLQRRQALTTSLKVAEHFEKNHRDVLKAIDNLIAEMASVSDESLFIQSTYVDAKGGRRYPMYLMNRDGFTLLAMGFTGAKALQFKLEYLAAFNTMADKQNAVHDSTQELGDDAMHTQIIDGKEYLVADTMEEALISWFGQDTGKQMHEILSAKGEPRLKCVYLLQMNNGTIKIGVAQDFYKRLNTISNSSGMEVTRWCYTELLPQREAYKIENACHSAFHKQRLKGEFFNTEYDDAKAELLKHARIHKQFED